MVESTLCFWTLLLVVALVQPIQMEVNSNQPQASKVRKRNYYSRNMPRTTSLNSLSLYNAGKLFKPSSYAISRPYYIPVYGMAGGNLIFYPPQPFYINPGVPKDNPSIPTYQAPSYLPPSTSTKSPVADRLGGFNEDDDAPIWGIVGQAQRPLNSAGTNKEYGVIPTRPPSAAAINRPPLVHASSSNEEDKENRRTSAASTSNPQSPAGPSNCVWAIVSCCSSANPNLLSQSCFEQRGCPGPFWGNSPCSSDFARAAVQTAMNYYNNNPAG